MITVLMNAGPWLPVPPLGYGGIENVIATLVPLLRKRGVRVVLATVWESRLPVDRRIWMYQQPQFAHLLRPYNQVMGVAHAHMQRVVAEIRRRRDIDLTVLDGSASTVSRRRSSLVRRRRCGPTASVTHTWRHRWPAVTAQGAHVR